jgi:hypothetical protein
MALVHLVVLVPLVEKDILEIGAPLCLVEEVVEVLLDIVGMEGMVELPPQLIQQQQAQMGLLVAVAVLVVVVEELVLI